MGVISSTSSVRRTRWRAGSALTSAALTTELDQLTGRQEVHVDQAHGKLGTVARAVSSRVRAVDGTVEMTSLKVGVDRREWAIAMGHKALSLGWSAGARIVCHVVGKLTVRGALRPGPQSE